LIETSNTSTELKNSRFAELKAGGHGPAPSDCPEGVLSRVKRAALHAAYRMRLLSLFSRYTRDTAAVIMFHRIGSPKQPGMEITADCLEASLAYLRDRGYRIISLDDFVTAIQERRSLYKTVVLTVDDGYSDLYTNAYPVLQKYDAPVSVFVATDFIDGALFYWWDQLQYIFEHTAVESIDATDLKLGHIDCTTALKCLQQLKRLNPLLKTYRNELRLETVRALADRLEVEIPDSPPPEYAPLSWEQVHEMASGRIDFYPHTRTHAIMSQLTRERMVEEVTESRNRLERELDRRADIFCYPSGEIGHFNALSADVLKEAGYRAAVTGVPGFDSTTGSTNLFELKRIAMPTDLTVFAQYVGGLEHWKEKLRRR